MPFLNHFTSGAGNPVTSASNFKGWPTITDWSLNDLKNFGATLSAVIKS